jgi:hypothetical protein
MTVTWLFSTVGNNKINDAKNAGKLLAILIAMGMRWWDMGHIAQWSTARASMEATGCRHWASICAVLPQRPPWSAISVENIKH